MQSHDLLGSGDGRRRGGADEGSSPGRVVMENRVFEAKAQGRRRLLCSLPCSLFDELRLDVAIGHFINFQHSW